VSGNFDLLNFNAADLVPVSPEAGKNDAETIEILLDHSKKLTTALQDVLQLMASKSNLGFTSMTDGTGTSLSSDNGVLTFSDSGTSTVTLDEDTGTLTFAGTGYTSGDGEAMVTEINANATTTISAGLISISSSQVSDVSSGADNTASNPQTSTWLSDTGAVLNTGITMNADGTLSGAGAGQTTLAGLGFSGDTNATNGATWGSNLFTIPDRFTDSIPAGSGVVITVDAMGYYTSGKKLAGSVTGTFVVGEEVTQATTEAKGLVYDVQAGYIVVHTIDGTFSGSTTITGGTSQATITSVTVTAEQAFGALITATGDFYFAGNDGNYIAWDGQSLKVRGEILADDIKTGKINGLVGEFSTLTAAANVTIGASQGVQSAGSANGAWWDGTDFSFHFKDATADFDADGVAVGDYIKVGTDLYYIWLKASSTKLFCTPYVLKGGSGITYTIIRNTASGAITVDEAGTPTVPATTVTIGTMSAARISGGTAGAFNGSAITALNATQLTSGTVPDARQATDVVGMKSGQYTGDATGDGLVDIDLGAGNVAFHVVVKALSGTKHSGEAIYDGVAFRSFRQDDTANPVVDQVSQISNGFRVDAAGGLAANFNVNAVVFAYTAWYFIN